MSDLINRQDAIDMIETKEVNKYGDCLEYNIAFNDGLHSAVFAIEELPSAEPEIIPIEELSNQLGCATIQSALYWFEFLKTLDSLGFAIIRKERK